MADAPTYRVRTVADFLTIPADRRAKALAEFPAYLEILETVQPLLSTGLVEREAAEVFQWVDDGKEESRVAIINREDGTTILETVRKIGARK